MTDAWLWISPGLGAAIVGGDELLVARAARRDPAATARTAHSLLRGEWVRALSKQPGSELLAVQALRNSLMSATITASTAAVVLMGSVNFSCPTPGALHRRARAHFGVVLEVALALALFAAFACSQPRALLPPCRLRDVAARREPSASAREHSRSRTCARRTCTAGACAASSTRRPSRSVCSARS